MTATASVSSSRAASRHRSTALDVPIYRTSSSRSSSAFATPPEAEENLDWVWWTDENGSPGKDFVSAASVIRRLVKSYKTYFKNSDDPEDKSFEVEAMPCTELEYPNNNACETFILLVPKDPDHYNPIMCLENSLYTIIDCYLTPAQKALFGNLPTGLLSDHTPPPSPPSSPAVDPSGDIPKPPDDPEKPTRSNHLRTLQRAIRRRDGPLFLQTMDTINYLLRSLKYPPLPDDLFASPLPNQLMTNMREDWAQSSPRGIPRRVLLRVVEETYQRTVGPNVGQLSRYSAFSSEVYGELMPSFITNVIAQTGLRTGSLLVDLGSGVGNVLVQASLSTGCSAFGVEVMAGPAALAESQLQQIRTRCRMWGLRIGDIELVEGDMLSNSRVDELLPKADVVLVNNKVFQESLNAALRPKFLDLKEGAVVVSLKPFVQPNARVTERNVDDICAIFDVEEQSYRSGDVSWGSGGGSYYLHRVDRVGYATIRERFEHSRARSVRAGRR
ncbi:histone methylation protein DOT1-domain-containing protein [Scleroderma citrinum]